MHKTNGLAFYCVNVHINTSPERMADIPNGFPKAVPLEVNHGLLVYLTCLHSQQVYCHSDVAFALVVLWLSLSSSAAECSYYTIHALPVKLRSCTGLALISYCSRSRKMPICSSVHDPTKPQKTTKQSPALTIRHLNGSWPGPSLVRPSLPACL